MLARLRWPSGGGTGHFGMALSLLLLSTLSSCGLLGGLAWVDHGRSRDGDNLLAEPPLVTSARYSNAQDVESLLQRGFAPDETNEAGDTALHVAARLGRGEIVKVLLPLTRKLLD